MKQNVLLPLGGFLALAAGALGQTTSSGFAPANFGNSIFTSTPSNATGSGGVSTVFTSSGSEFTFGTGGNLINPAQYTYATTGPNTATITTPASGSTAASTTNLVFTSANQGTYTTTSGNSTTTGTFNLAAIPSSAPIANVSSRGMVGTGGSATVGFVIAGTAPRRVLIRAVGPGLAPFGVTNTLTNPSLNVYRAGQLLATNDDWGTMASLSSGTSSGSGSSSTGSTSAGSGGASSGGTGSGSTSSGSTSAGGSTSGGTSSGTSSSSTATGTVSNGVFTGTMANGSSFMTQLATAQNFTSLGAFSLSSGARDSALVATLPPGPYTVVVSNSATASSSTGSSSGGTGSGSSSAGTGSGTSTGSTSGGTSGGTGGTGTSSTGDSTGTSSGSTSGGTSGGTSSGSTSGGTGGGTSSGTTSSGSTSGGASGGTSSSSTGSTSTGSTSSASTTSTAAEVLIEVYFIE